MYFLVLIVDVMCNGVSWWGHLIGEGAWLYMLLIVFETYVVFVKHDVGRLLDETWRIFEEYTWIFYYCCRGTLVKSDRCIGSFRVEIEESRKLKLKRRLFPINVGLVMLILNSSSETKGSSLCSDLEFLFILFRCLFSDIVPLLLWVFRPIFKWSSIYHQIGLIIRSISKYLAICLLLMRIIELPPFPGENPKLRSCLVLNLLVPRHVLLWLVVSNWLITR